MDVVWVIAPVFLFLSSKQCKLYIDFVVVVWPCQHSKQEIFCLKRCRCFHGYSLELFVWSFLFLLLARVCYWQRRKKKSAAKWVMVNWVCVAFCLVFLLLLDVFYSKTDIRHSTAYNHISGSLWLGRKWENLHKWNKSMFITRKWQIILIVSPNQWTSP